MLNNNDIKILCDVEKILHNYIKNDDDNNYDLWTSYWNVVEKIIQNKNKRNLKAAQLKKRKRKNDPNYARSKKEIEKRKNKKNK